MEALSLKDTFMLHFLLAFARIPSWVPGREKVVLMYRGSQRASIRLCQSDRDSTNDSGGVTFHRGRRQSL